MKSITKLCDEVIALSEKATEPGVWHEEVFNDFGRYHDFYFAKGPTHSKGTAQDKAMALIDAELIIHYRSSAPKLALMVKVMEETLKSISKKVDFTQSDFLSLKEVVETDTQLAKQALAECQKIVEE